MKRIVNNGILPRNALIDFVIDLSRSDFIVEVNCLILFFGASSGIQTFSLLGSSKEPRIAASGINSISASSDFK